MTHLTHTRIVVYCCHSNVRKLFDFWRFQVVFNWIYTKIGSLIIADRREMNIEQLRIIYNHFQMNCFFIFLHSFLLQKCQLCFFFNNSKSIVEWLQSAIKKTDHVISPNQTVSYKSRFYRRGYLSKFRDKKVCLKKQSLEKKKTSKMTACWEPEASCSLCNQTLEGHPEDYTMIFPPPARWEKGGKNGLSSFFIQSWGWTLISHVVPHDLKNRARVMILW